MAIAEENAEARPQPEESEAPLILVADDEPDLREYLSFVLRRAGFRVLLAEDGHSALKFAVHKPDLLLLDIGMPKLDGYAVCRIVQAMGESAPPLIFLTARAGSRDIMSGLQSGAVDYVTKPFSRDDLIARVRKAIAEHRSRD